MGKTKPRRDRGHRPDPTGKEENGDHAGDSEAGSGAGDAGDDTIANLVEQLKSPAAEERLCGCLTFSQLVSRQLTVHVLRTHRLVRLVGPLLVDPSTDTRQAAAGALRNLSVNGGKEGCDLMLDQDILTSLLTALGKFGTDWKPQRKVEKGAVLLDAESEIFVQLTNLLWNLCEASERAVAAFNRSGACAVLLRCLDAGAFPAEVVLAAGQCLHALSEENATVAAQARQQLPTLRALVAAESDTGDRLLLRVLALGILLNVCAGGGSSEAEVPASQVVSLVSSTLTPNARQLACSLTSDRETEDYELRLGDLSLLLNAQQVALEILTDFVSGDDASEGKTDADSPDSDEEEEGEEMMDDEDWLMDSGDSALPAELREALLSGGLLRSVLAKADSPPTNVTEVLGLSAAGQQLSRRFSTLRCRVFLCLNNLVSALELTDLGGETELVALWQQMCQLVLTEDAAGDAALLEAAGAAMRAVLQRLLASGCRGPAELGAPQLSALTARAAGCEDAAARATLVRGVGLLGCLRVKGCDTLPPPDAQVVQEVGAFLLERSASDPELLVVAEALDVTMDVFGEDCTDAAAAAIQLVPKLRSLQAGLKAKISLQKRRLGAHYPLVATVRTNLPRFIKYKAARVSAVQLNGNGVRL